MASVKNYLQEQFLDTYEDPHDHIRAVEASASDEKAVIVECSETVPVELLNYVQDDVQLRIAGITDINRDTEDDRHIQAKITLKHDDSPDL